MPVIIDYGVGNVGSIKNMFRKVGSSASIGSTVDAIARADMLILPGVGAFDSGINHLRASGLVDVLNQRVLDDNIPVLGICLGAQLMSKSSEEGVEQGLGWFDAQTLRMDFAGIPGKWPLPNVGWRNVTAENGYIMLDGIDEAPRFYFVHSYYLAPNDPGYCLDEDALWVRIRLRLAQGQHPLRAVPTPRKPCVWYAILPQFSERVFLMHSRYIPILLLQDAGLYKTRKFKKGIYLGDPVNTIRIFNDKLVDELLFLDIAAARSRAAPNIEMLRDIASECFMPLTYGGGINSVEQVRKILAIGFEKVVVNTAAWTDPNLVPSLARVFGSSTIVGSIDVSKNWMGREKVYIQGGRQVISMGVVEWGAGAREAGCR